MVQMNARRFFSAPYLIAFFIALRVFAEPTRLQPGGPLTLPDAVLTDQFGHEIRLRELAAGKTVAINFIFTTCQTICLPMGANFAKLESLLSAQGRKDVALISITVDPLNDTPDRLKRWAAQFHGGPMWTLLTGPKPVVDGVLKELGGFTSDKLQHSSLLVVGRTGAKWEPGDALMKPEALAALIAKYPASAPAAGVGRYLTDVVLIDQTGTPKRLYTDLVKGKTVVVNAFFTSCKDSCPIMAGNLAALQTAFADRLGKDLVMLSISVDPQNDTPAILHEYANRFKARSGWYFLSGSKENVDFALHRLGLYPENGAREQHLTLFIIGNEPTGLWKKAKGQVSAAQIIPVVDSVLNDRNR